MKNTGRIALAAAGLLLVLAVFAASAAAMKPGSQVGAEQDQVQGDAVSPGPVGDGGNEESPGPGGDSEGDGVPDNENPEQHQDRTSRDA